MPEDEEKDEEDEVEPEPEFEVELKVWPKVPETNKTKPAATHRTALECI